MIKTIVCLFSRNLAHVSAFLSEMIKHRGTRVEQKPHELLPLRAGVRNSSSRGGNHELWFQHDHHSGQK